MKLAILALFTILAVHTARGETAKSRANVKSEIDDAATDVTNQRRARKQKIQKKRDQLKNATSVQDTMSPSERDRLKKSIPSLMKKLEAKPGDIALLIQLGKAYLVNGEYEKAVTHLKEASQTPSNSTLYLLAEAYRGKEDYLDEIRTLEVVTQTDQK
ncbi:MAG: hypothetical protein ABL958_22015, partial [Bdellovibrionia bacterium]